MKIVQRAKQWASLSVFLWAAGCSGPTTPAEDRQATQTNQNESPLFVNGGFETGDFTSWTKLTFLNNTGLLVVPPGGESDLQLATGGADFTFALTNAVPQSQIPTGLVAGTGVPLWPRFGTTSVAVNQFGSGNPPGKTNHQGANQNVNAVKQSMATTAADIDPSDGKVHVRFVLAPELEAAGHVPAKQPYFFVVVRNLTSPRNQDLYSNFNFANQPGVPWTTQGTGATALLFTDWQIFDIVPDDSKFQVGDTLEVEVYAAGCQPGGHSGTAYIDGFGASLPSLAISKSAPTSVNVDTDITYTFTVQNNTSGIAPNVVADEVIPPNTTFQSYSAPGATCTAPAVGGTGKVSCTYGWMNPGASQNFTVTVRAFPAATNGSGTATAATGTTLTDSTKSALWTANQYQGYTAFIVSGTGAGQQRTIASNTTTVLTLLSAWTTTPDTTSAYKIINPPTVLSRATGNGGGAATLQDTTQTWTSEQWLGWNVSILTGTGNGQSKPIIDSTTNVLTAGSNWANGKQPDNTSVYAITLPVTSIVNGNYGVAGPTVSRLLGPKRETTISTGVVYTDLGLTYTDGTSGVIWGGSTTYTITVTNNGPSTVTGATLADTFPAQLATHGWSCAPAAACGTSSGSGNIATTINLAVGASVTITVNATIIAGTGTGTVTNTATITAPSGVIDNFPANNSASDQDTISTTLRQLSVTKDPTNTGTGTVTSSPAAISCGPGCTTASANFGDASLVTLYAVAVPNNTFLGWSGDCSGTAPTCTVTMSAARNVTVKFTSCGNNILEANEGCDDGNLNNNDGCNSSCLVENTRACNATSPGLIGNVSCASGVCDAVGNAAPGKCEPAATCGNGKLEANEGCDDGNIASNDGCSAACLVENTRACNATSPGLIGNVSCVSGVCDAVGNAAPGKCEPAATCGNGKLEANEGCDDGNTANGDGCSSTCLVENTGPCNATSPGLIGNVSCVSGVCDAVGNAAPGKCEAANACGNGKLEAGEGCDDGNTTNGDGCNSTCKVENTNPCNANVAGAVGNNSCASGVCDAVGNAAPGKCEAANTCGNGKLEAGEGCDDGNTANGDGCNSTCLVENTNPCNANVAGAVGNVSCASGVCDAVGNAAPGKCEAANTCGNGKLEAGEGCDDGNTTNGDGCNSTCLVETTNPCNANVAGAVGNASCASGVCDAVGNAAPGKCEAANTCGNGKLEAGEGCDDGNVANSDGCSSTCLVENTRPCNATAPGVTGNASCLSGVCDAVGNAAPGKCEPAATCGNGKLEANEGCDDGNTTNGDGCSSTCLVENTGSCNATSPGLIGNVSCVSGVCDAVGNAAPGKCEAANTCGNGKLEAGEGCDDGNTTNGDGCNSTCLVETTNPCNANVAGAVGNNSCASGVCDAVGNAAPGKCEAANTCGNGKLEAGEGCDDGNTTDGDGCNPTCKVENTNPCNATAPGVTGNSSCASGVCDTVGNAAPGKCEPANTCGNGVLEAGEGCDDGNTASGDGCNSTCLVETTNPCNANVAGAVGNASCASGICDTVGNAAPGKCEAANACGNGKLEAGEGCDDGNISGGDGCDSNCKIEDTIACNADATGATGNASCASGVCDVTGNTAPGKCEAANTCGNGKLEAGEGCDDGNTASGDGCNSTCLVETTRACNASAPGLTAGASCASGVCDVTGNAAPGVCEAANTCGNGKLEAGEGCDDGNTASGDGCNSSCKIENTIACNADTAGATGDSSCASSVCDVSAGAPGVCKPSQACGNGRLEAGEGCDDSNNTDGDGCSATCLIENGTPCSANNAGAVGNASCASGICDVTGNTAPGKCEAANTCGNGVLEAGEGCDDGNTANGDSCDATCKIENGLPCNGNASGTVGDVSCASGVCDTTGGQPGVCEAANTCGNGKLEAGEGCDDGNVANGDGCSSTCKVEDTHACNATAPGATGNSSCASGICDTTGGQPGVCEPANTCGNGKLEAGEGCDDGNTTNSDGCSSTCKIENTHACNATAPGVTGNSSCASGVCDTTGGQPGVCEAANTCGNGKLEAGEGCDDGNVANGDGCSSTCKVEDTHACNATTPGATGNASCASGVCDVTGNAAPGVCEAANTCGNGKLEAGEGCDDGNSANGDGCNSTCKIELTHPCNAAAPGLTAGASCASGVCDVTGNAAPGVCEAANTCGNGVLEAGEGCDDGNTANGDGCNASCKVEDTHTCNATAPGATGNSSCASGICDVVGNAAPGKCEAANTCGNGVLESGEGCDDGNVTNGDGCNSTCKVENAHPCNAAAPGSIGDVSCASGVCDVTGNAAPGVCEAANTCGNGKLEAGEGCDDGNSASGDGCNATCKIELTHPCNGNASGAVGDSSCASNVCDTRGNTAPGVCEAVSTCGNGKLEAGEGCDDGNTANGDGCNASCKVEDTHACNANTAGATGNDSCASANCDATAGAPGVCQSASVCGNGKLEAGEGCDDSNTANGDGCSSTCKVEVDHPCNVTGTGATGDDSCATGVCDTVGGANVCKPANVCGNGKIEAGEQCDDGNTTPGDGCSATCQLPNHATIAGGGCTAAGGAVDGLGLLGGLLVLGARRRRAGR